MKKTLYSILYMFLITFCFTALVSGIRYLNQEKIEQNMAMRRQAVILSALNISSQKIDSAALQMSLYNERIKQRQILDRDIYIGLDNEGQAITGYAFSASGQGFWGPISCMIGISGDMTHLLGIVFYENTETPGLGARITEDWFQKQFTGLSLKNKNSSGNFFTLSPAGSEKTSDDFDAITGATGTSDAVEKFLNRELRLFINRIAPLLIKET
ncbi:MAG: FMN-binding protein [Nitrospira sp.]|nr:FMN-binding protein [bacterium]MBL7048092.1 FMN-binding protein [Nitrospira sp.]